jgi:hypothetical protein
MQPYPDPINPAALNAFVECVGARAWGDRLEALRSGASVQTRAGRQRSQRHCIEFTIERLRRGLLRQPSVAEQWIASLAAAAVALFMSLPNEGRQRLVALLRASLADDACLVPVFHLLRTAELQRSRGFDVAFAGLEDGTPFDLLLRRDGTEAEVVCDVISAEEGRDVHRGAWFSLVDRIDPELQTWLCMHPGRYILKMTLPRGLRDAEGDGLLAALHARITAMLDQSRRADHDEAAVLRLDPLMLAAAQADEVGLMPRLRREFGPEAHLSVTAAGGGIFVMAARAGREDEVAAAIRRRLSAIAPARLSGKRPGILSMFVEDTDRPEWRSLRDKPELEGEARKFMTFPEARNVVAITVASRLELFGLPEPDSAPGGELRFRNPAHPAAKTPALAPAVLSSM